MGISMTENTRGFVTRLMEEAVALKGEDYVYHPPLAEDEYGDEYEMDCQYINPDGNPGCIVGHVLVAAGADPVEIHKHEGCASTRVAPLFIGLDFDTNLALVAAQRAQDEGKTWGEALKAFKERLARDE